MVSLQSLSLRSLPRPRGFLLPLLGIASLALASFALASLESRAEVSVATQLSPSAINTSATDSSGTDLSGSDSSASDSSASNSSGSVSEATTVSLPPLSATQEIAARDLETQLRCLTCDGQSVADSNAQFALDIRILIRERLQRGDSPAAIESYLIEQYGEYIAFSPRSHSVLPLWIMVIVGMVAGMLVVWYCRPKH
ncbi:MAG: cytochrome c-type biogenesis protein CcmH [Alphaproteobacteria bacterium]|nr:cytochrome c-type biogenesis protein CcmH [Alphaproteobacteria bacterium]